MKKVYLLKVNQNGHERYLGSADARTLVKMARKAELNEVQEAQRPIEPKRLKDLAKFEMEDGTLSTSLVIGTIDDRIQIHSIDDPKVKGILYYTEFPETQEEFDNMQDAFDVMDGQHRLFSFLPEYSKLPDDTVYELSFEMYIQPTIKERRTIFKNTNEEQKSVAPNLLMWFRYQLDLLSVSEKEYYNVVSMLNEENSSPLKGRIIMSAEHVVGGIKAKQLIDLFNKIKLRTSITTANLDDDKLFMFISVYLKGWEKAVDSKFVDREQAVGAFSKISGLRYMFNLISTYYDLAQSSGKDFTDDFVKQKVQEFFSNYLGITPREFFNKNSEHYKDGQYVYPFAGETDTNLISEEHKQYLRGMKENNYDPLAWMKSNS